MISAVLAALTTLRPTIIASIEAQHVASMLEINKRKNRGRPIATVRGAALIVTIFTALVMILVPVLNSFQALLGVIGFGVTFKQKK
jgi:hypothetical protein